MEMKSFADVIAYLEGFLNLEKRTQHYTTREYRLDRMVALLNHVGNPQRSFQNDSPRRQQGKSSTASFIASGLAAQGYKTGLYMSTTSSTTGSVLPSAAFFSDEALVHRRPSEDAGRGISPSATNGPPRRPLNMTTFAYLLFKEEVRMGGH